MATMGDGHGVLISRDDGRTWVTRGNITMDNSHLYEVQLPSGPSAVADVTNLFALLLLPDILAVSVATHNHNLSLLLVP